MVMLKQIVMKKILFMLLLSSAGFLSAQVTYFESDLNLTKHKETDMKFWDMAVNANFQFSVIDIWLQDKRESDFRFGDMLGVKGGIGAGRYTELTPVKDGHFNIPFNYGLMWGAFAGYKNEQFGIFFKFQREYFASIHLQNPANYLYVSDVKTISLIYKDTHWVDACFGSPVKKKSDTDDQYKLLRFSYRYFTEGAESSAREYIGLAAEFVDENNMNTFNTYSFLGGFIF